MYEGTAAELAVAWLQECGEGTTAFRREPGRPIHGHCLITPGTDGIRVTLYTEHGIPLCDRSGHGSFYYEGWLLNESSTISLGAFNLNASGDGCLTWESPAAAGRPMAVRVTAEPFGGTESGGTSVMEGRLVWLGTNEPIVERGPIGGPSPWRDSSTRDGLMVGMGEPGASPAVEPIHRMEFEGAPSPVLVAEREPMSMPEQSPVLTEEETPADFPNASDSEVTVPPLDSPMGTTAQESSETADEPEVTAALPSQPSIRMTTVRELAIVLSGNHPLAPRATGTVVLTPAEGGLLLSVRGLPNPTAMGRDPYTNRPYNAYRVWLAHQRLGARHAVGICTRVWGENYRLQVESEIPLSRYDTILVTVDERTATAPNPNAPQVLTGSYRVRAGASS